MICRINLPWLLAPRRFSGLTLGLVAILTIAAPNIDRIQQLAQSRYGSKATQMVQPWNEMMQINCSSPTVRVHGRAR